MRLDVETLPGLPASASRLPEGLHAWIPGVMELLGLTEPGPPVRVLLAPEASPLARAVPSWVAGYADPPAGTVVLLAERTPSYPDGGLEEVLAHEVTHVLIYRASGGHKVPRWFDEGLAMLAGRSFGLSDQTHLALALLSGDRVPLIALDGEFRGEAWQVRRAYALSGSLVQDLLEHYGPGLPRAVLSRLARGLSFDEALREATGSSLLDVGESFYARQTALKRWIPILTSSAVLWFGITVFAVVAALKRRHEKVALARLTAAEGEPPPGAGPVN